ncbi:uncharacterized protein LOC125218576 isoform X2 [Salvia hispanica]|uniref:uncharacterized protein LOC125218576 isoform X2 n=1 Tax=Salvia hispanica TaxID=49212 RepID=UPI0020099DF3|nr:uncharacterized protein LOC125218576 isoform X2 [Salvia hispanica]
MAQHFPYPQHQDCLREEEKTYEFDEWVPLKCPFDLLKPFYLHVYCCGNSGSFMLSLENACNAPTFSILLSLTVTSNVWPFIFVLLLQFME